MDRTIWLKTDHMARILVIDDEKSIRSTLKEVLEYENHSVALAADGPEGLELLDKEHFDVVLCDIKMPQMDGIEVLENIMSGNYDTQVIMISGHGTIDTAVEAIKKGAFDFISKPLDLNRLMITIRNALDKKHLIAETRTLKRKIDKAYEMVGESEAMQRSRNS